MELIKDEKLSNLYYQYFSIFVPTIFVSDRQLWFQDKTLNTHFIDIYICIEFWEPRIQLFCLSSAYVKFIREYYVFLIFRHHNFLPDNSCLLKAKERTLQWWIKCEKMIPDIHLMCEVSATVNVYRAEGSLSEVDLNFFPKKVCEFCWISISLTGNK